jgi:hypothetical protein
MRYFLHKVESHWNVRIDCVFKNYSQLIQSVRFIQRYLKEKVETSAVGLNGRSEY